MSAPPTAAMTASFGDAERSAEWREVRSFIRGCVVAGRAHAAEPYIATAPQPSGAQPNRTGLR
ncbi:hypothetical protein GCM10009579_23260 [Streptomyces javensis]|uniref:Uncharacterized protein n=1 Tax=Streptomyces javensis TaxID=114698 RepID=A0ABN1WT20_9ACTN